MKHINFGCSGLRVSELCLGAITFGDTRSFGTSPQESQAMLRAFADAGGSFIDTAHLYAGGESERIVGEFVWHDRDSYVVSTKYTPAREGGPQRAGNGRKNMMRSLEESLRRLGSDYIDVYWLHARDAETPWHEILRGLDDLVRMGKVLYVAVSDTPAWEISRANMLAELRGFAPLVGIQVEYSLVERTPERDLLPMAGELGLGVTAWAPLAGGTLSGKYTQPQGSGEASRLVRDAIAPRSLRIAELVSEVAAELGVTSAQVALAWLRTRRAGGKRVIPIVGARTSAQAGSRACSTRSASRSPGCFCTIRPRRGTWHGCGPLSTVRAVCSCLALALLAKSPRHPGARPNRSAARSCRSVSGACQATTEVTALQTPLRTDRGSRSQTLRGATRRANSAPASDNPPEAISGRPSARTCAPGRLSPAHREYGPVPYSLRATLRCNAG